MNLKPIANIQKTDRYFFILSCSFQIAFLTNCHFENGNQHIAKWGNMKDKKLTLILFCFYMRSNLWILNITYKIYYSSNLNAIQNRFKIIVFESFTMLFPLLHHPNQTHIFNIPFVKFFASNYNDVYIHHRTRKERNSRM